MASGYFEKERKKRVELKAVLVVVGKIIVGLFGGGFLVAAIFVVGTFIDMFKKGYWEWEDLFQIAFGLVLMAVCLAVFASAVAAIIVRW